MTVDRLFDFAYTTSTPEAVAIIWHGIITAAPFVAGVAITAGGVLWKARRTRHENEALARALNREQAQRDLAAVYARVIAAHDAGEAPSALLREDVRVAVERARLMDKAQP